MIGIHLLVKGIDHLIPHPGEYPLDLRRDNLGLKSVLIVLKDLQEGYPSSPALASDTIAQHV